MKTLYLCDRREKCREESGCGERCELTWNPKHANNGGCEDPAAHPERFFRYKDFFIERGGRDETAFCEQGMA